MFGNMVSELKPHRGIILTILPLLMVLVISSCGNAAANDSEKRANSGTLFSDTVAELLTSTVQFTPTSTTVPQEFREPGNTQQVPTQVPVEATPALAVTETEFSTLPDEHYIWDIRGHKQYFPLGCEASVAVDWAAYFDININEFEFQHKLPLSDNPDLGFVGGVEGPWGQVPPYSYGVHADPVANLLVEYGLNARGVKDFTIDEIKAQVSQDKPVMVWVIGNVVGGVPYEYTDSNGNTTVVAAYEHVVIVTGYDEETIRYMNNGKFYDVPTDVFVNSWSVLGKMVVYLED